MRRPRIVPELLDAEADLLLVVVDREDDGLDVVALVVEVGRVVDLAPSTRGRVLWTMPSTPSSMPTNTP